MKKAIFLFLAITLFVNAYPQKKWSLEECINYAYENNLQIKRQALNVDYNKNNLSQSKFNTLPNLNGQWNHTFSSGKTIDYNRFEYVNQSYWSGNMGLGSDITVFSGLSILNDIKQEKIQISASPVRSRKNQK